MAVFNQNICVIYKYPAAWHLLYLQYSEVVIMLHIHTLCVLFQHHIYIMRWVMSMCTDSVILGSL